MELALLDDRNGQLTNLLPNVTVTNLSEYHLWSAPNVSAMPILVTADFVWAEGEPHYGSHRYTITSYVYSQQSGLYSQRDEYVTATEYNDKILEPEKDKIFARLETTIDQSQNPTTEGTRHPVLAK